ncbi:MAG: hypothetical protein ABI042_12745 [Verrucomicrobiota bacterium]
MGRPERGCVVLDQPQRVNEAEGVIHPATFKLPAAGGMRPTRAPLTEQNLRRAAFASKYPVAVAENQPIKNRVKSILSFKEFSESLLDFIRSEVTSQTEIEFNELALSLFSLQFFAVAPYRKFCEARKVSPTTIRDWSEIPALPTSAFKEFEISSLKQEDRTYVFHSSGTTEQIPSRHFHNANSLAIYEASLLPWFQKHFLGDWDEDSETEILSALTLTLSPEEREQRSDVRDIFKNSDSDSVAGISLQRNTIPPLLGGEGRGEGERFFPSDKPGFIFLTPSPALAPNSSLVHMFETVRRELGSRDSLFTGLVARASCPCDSEGEVWDSTHGQDARATTAWTLAIEQTLFALRKSMCANRPVGILGTAFLFVHLLDHFAANNIRYRLATGSRVLETGGYKGRSRTLPKDELHQLITKHLGIPASHIVCEYGMSELSSQAYDSQIQNEKIKNKNERIFHFPPWARAKIISPETGKEVGEGETGLICIFDLANVFSVLAIQTEDLGIRRGDGFELIGRASLAEPRGCSLMAN